jgi:copper(I)-binding protein
MFMELTQPLAEGETVSGTLSFERAGNVVVSFQVMGLGAPGPGAETGQHQHH